MTDKNETTEAPSLRQQIRDMDVEDFAAKHTKVQLTEICEMLQMDTDNLKSKADFAIAIYKKFPAADPALRGKSDGVVNPVACVWAAAHNMFTDSDEKPRRKDVVAACVAAGIAFYTARTQYQAWFKFTTGGENMIQQDTTGLPKGLGALLGFAVVEEPKSD